MMAAVLSEKNATAQNRWIMWSIIAGFWIAVGVLSAVQFYYTLLGENVPVNGQKVFAVQAAQWFLWIPFSGVILWLGWRFPFERKHWVARLLVHLAASAVLACIHVALYALVIALLEPFPWRTDYAFAGIFWGQLRSIFDLDFLIYWGVLGAGVAFTYYQKYREGELHAVALQAQLAQAQLQALKMQLHPHFLFNTLNAIAALVRKNENLQATDMIAGLSDLLRLALENAGTQEVSLRQELEFLERYLAIEQIRFGDRLRVQMQIAPETLAARVPNLILQPLVENAIRHGVASRSSAGTIAIRATRDIGVLHLQIADDGPGFSAAAQTSAGVGLTNTRARLQRLYGTSQKLVLENAKHGGAVVTLGIPFALAAILENANSE
jgi:two-component sensor histidine kinase